ncbi:MAG: hypothetical protein HQL37_11960 [Alphaproteobacteria bacterium]|nr:hypothetical protein [Alphaproteobacteria bacterium]
MMIPARLREIFAESSLSGILHRTAGWAMTRTSQGLERWGERVRTPFRLDKLASSTLHRVLQNNSALRGVGVGQRCFVLASGPSTSSQDLTRLRGEAVIAVNEMFLRLRDDGVRPTVLTFLDGSYLEDKEGYRRFLVDFTKAAADTSAVALMPIGARDLLHRLNLVQSVKAHYMTSVGRILDYQNFHAAPPLDFTAPLPGLYTVTHVALALAIFMGYSDIHLLGVDMDYIARPNQPIYHGYGVNPYNDHDRLSVLDAYDQYNNWDYPAMLQHTAEQMRAFQWLNQIAACRNQLITNANPGGLLEAFIRQPFDSLFR